LGCGRTSEEVPVSLRYVYVDESKRGRYLMVAVTLDDPDATRKGIAGLILPGQRRLHMVRERDSRRRLILSTFAGMGVEAVVYDAGRNYPTDREARGACLVALVEDQTGQDTRLVIEQDDSLVHSDRLVLYRSSHQIGRRATLAYVHDRASSEVLLAVPDAIAWAWPQGGDWRRRVAPLIRTVRQV
jgi:hypothetical protein